jgi:2,3-bisphosphoglycerate-dependent phosphoglycerate mutase
MASRLKLYLVRHGESEANLDKTVNQRVADHRINLSPLGWQQGRVAGEILAGLLPANRHETRVYVSPYARTLQTWTAIKDGMVGWPGLTQHSPEKRDLCHNLTHIESVFLRECEYGLFDGVTDEELPVRFPAEYSHYAKLKNFEGEFYARMPGGESRCDVAQRVHQFFGTLHRDEERHGINNAVIISHGITLRAFAMMWRNLGVDWMERERNPKNCSIRGIEGTNWSNLAPVDGYIFKGGRNQIPAKNLQGISEKSSPP